MAEISLANFLSGDPNVDKARIEYLQHELSTGSKAQLGLPATTTAPQVTYTAPQVTYTPIDYTSYIKELSEQKRQQALAQLEKSRQAALSALEAEKAQIQPQYYSLRQDVGVQNKLAAKSFAEYIAARGLRTSGENTQEQIARNVALQSQLGALKRQEQQAYEDIARRASQVETGYQSDLAAIEAGLAANELEQLIEAMKYQDQMKYQISRDVMEDYYRQQQLSMQQQTTALENEIKALQLKFLPEQQQLELERIKAELAQLKAIDPELKTQEAKLRLQQLQAAIALTKAQAASTRSKEASDSNYYKALQAAQDEILRRISAGDVPTEDEQKQIVEKWARFYGVPVVSDAAMLDYLNSSP